MHNIKKIILIICLIGITSWITLSTSAQDISGKVHEAFTEIVQSEGKSVWSETDKLIGIGRTALKEVKAGYQHPNLYVHLATSKYLYVVGEKKEAVLGMKALLSSDDAQLTEQTLSLVNAIASWDHEMSQEHKDALSDVIKSRASATKDDFLKIQCWRTVWKLVDDVTAKRKMRSLLSSENKQVVHEAALGLAEMGSFAWTKKILPELAKDSTDQGRLARAYLSVYSLQRELERKMHQSTGNTKHNYVLLDELISLMEEKYYDPKKIDIDKLIEAAANGMGASLDMFTTYHDKQELIDIMDDMEGAYGGIGARVSMRKDTNGNRWLTIEEPIFSGPAYKAGLHSNDKITEIEGTSTVNRSVTELVKMLRGKEGVPVKFKVFRRGWMEEKEYTLTRAKVSLETTLYRMLPGDIGYIKLTTFGRRNGDEVEQAYAEMATKGMKALVFDLRGNGGGYLSTAVQIASMFVDKGELIVSTRGRGKEISRRVAMGGKRNPQIPMAILIDSGSASASEILSGALQDYNLATLIGTQTYGKGSVQEIHRLSSSDNVTALRITIAKWFLPSGRSIEKDPEHNKEGGVTPDIVVEFLERDLWKDAEFERIRGLGKLEDYIRKQVNLNKALFEKLAEGDGLDHAVYPEFDELYQDLNTKASKDNVRELVREYARREIADARGASFILDMEIDVQLQKAIMLLAEKLQVDYNKIPEYTIFQEMQKKHVRKEANGK